jgi:hypothetical protein
VSFGEPDHPAGKSIAPQGYTVKQREENMSHNDFCVDSSSGST